MAVEVAAAVTPVEFSGAVADETARFFVEELGMKQEKSLHLRQTLLLVRLRLLEVQLISDPAVGIKSWTMRSGRCDSSARPRFPVVSDPCVSPRSPAFLRFWNQPGPMPLGSEKGDTPHAGRLVKPGKSLEGHSHGRLPWDNPVAPVCLKPEIVLLPSSWWSLCYP
jgi:hypothetical protein